VRTGYQLARRYSEGFVVDRNGVILFLEEFMNSLDTAAADAHGEGALRFQAVSCAQEPGDVCQLATAVFTGIVSGGERALLIFWVPLPASPDTPIAMVWTGPVLPDEVPVVFEDGGNLFDLGEVFLVEES
jgi:hypothetical protein